MCDEPKEPLVEEEAPARWQKPRGPKYAPEEPTPPDRMDPRHVKTLATLVKKYGAAVVAEAAGMVASSSRARGRPRKGNLPRLEGIALANLFDDLVEQYRAAGSRHPKKAAMHELFEIAHPSRRNDVAALSRFTRTTKRKLPQGRRDLKAALERAAAIEQYKQGNSTKPRKKTRE